MWRHFDAIYTNLFEKAKRIICDIITILETGFLRFLKKVKAPVSKRLQELIILSYRNAVLPKFMTWLYQVGALCFV